MGIQGAGGDVLDDLTEQGPVGDRTRCGDRRLEHFAQFSRSRRVSPGAFSKCRRLPVRRGKSFAMAHAAIQRSPT